MWANVIEGLREQVELQVFDPAQPGLPVRPDVWLADGHGGALDVPGPLLVQVHELGWRHPEVPGMFDPDWSSTIEAVTVATVADADRVITGSEFARRELAAGLGISTERIDVVPHGVDLKCFRPDRPGGRTMVAHALGTPGERPYVAFAASVHPRKNLSALRDAVAGLARRGFPHVLAVMAGPALDRADSSDLEQEAFAELPGAAGRLARIIRPCDDELAMLLSGADAFCLPSLSEGFGLTALEAMACGTPVVVSDRGALPELVGEAGLVVTPTAQALEEALAAVLSDRELTACLRDSARKRAAQYPWAATVRGWLEALERTALQRHVVA